MWNFKVLPEYQSFILIDPTIAGKCDNPSIITLNERVQIWHAFNHLSWEAVHRSYGRMFLMMSIDREEMRDCLLINSYVNRWVLIQYVWSTYVAWNLVVSGLNPTTSRLGSHHGGDRPSKTNLPKLNGIYFRKKISCTPNISFKFIQLTLIIYI
jgi:hypothetical protein